MYLVLDLKGPMQAYGHSSNFDDRPTGLYPLRSHIVGMLAAAMGVRRDDQVGLEAFNEVAIEVLAWPGSLLNDFRTIGNGYDEGAQINIRLGGTAPIPMSADGRGFKPTIGHKQYLVGARFCVILSGSEVLLSKFGAAIENPIWMPFLGRADCLPSVGIMAHGPFESKEAAKTHAEGLIGSKAALHVLEARPGPGAMAMLARPIDFANRIYGPQYVVENWES